MLWSRNIQVLSASQSKTGSWGRGEVKEHRERSRCKWKLSTGLQQFANMNPDVAQKDSQSGESLDDQSQCMVQHHRKWPWPLVWLAYGSIFHPCVGQRPWTKMWNTEAIVHRKVVGGGKTCWHTALLKAIHRFTAHQAEKIYTPSEEGDSNMF